MCIYPSISGYLPSQFFFRVNFRLASFNEYVFIITGENPLKESGENSVNWCAEVLHFVLFGTFQ